MCKKLANINNLRLKKIVNFMNKRMKNVTTIVTWKVTVYGHCRSEWFFDKKIVKAIKQNDNKIKQTICCLKSHFNVLSPMSLAMTSFFLARITQSVFPSNAHPFVQMQRHGAYWALHDAIILICFSSLRMIRPKILP